MNGASWYIPASLTCALRQGKTKRATTNHGRGYRAMQRCNPRTAHVMDGTRHREGFTALPFFLPEGKFDSICQGLSDSL